MQKEQRNEKKSIFKKITFKKVLSVIAVLLILLNTGLSLWLISSYTSLHNEIASCENNVKAAFAQESDPKTQIVFVTKDGKKYHKAGCIYLKNKTDLTQMTEQQAIDQGYTACEECFK